MKKVIIKRKRGDMILFLEIVNCDDIKISYASLDPSDFYEYHIYYSLEKNILKHEYNDEEENVYTFTEKERNKIKRACLKLFLKEYNKISESPYKTQKINIINKYLEL